MVFLEKCSSEPIISASALGKLKQLSLILNEFYDQTDQLVDFEVIRREEVALLQKEEGIDTIKIEFFGVPIQIYIMIPGSFASS